MSNKKVNEKYILYFSTETGGEFHTKNFQFKKQAVEFLKSLPPHERNGYLIKKRPFVSNY